MKFLIEILVVVVGKTETRRGVSTFLLFETNFIFMLVALTLFGNSPFELHVA